MEVLDGEEDGEGKVGWINVWIAIWSFSDWKEKRQKTDFRRKGILGKRLTHPFMEK